MKLLNDFVCEDSILDALVALYAPLRKDESTWEKKTEVRQAANILFDKLETKLAVYNRNKNKKVGEPVEYEFFQL